MNEPVKWWREEYPQKDWKIFEDFRYFLLLVWRHLMLPDPTYIQYDIANFLQHGPRRSIIQAFRGVGKSWITAAFVCWLLLRDPQMKIMVVSASKDRADAFTTFTKRLIAEMPILEHLKPSGDQRDSMIAFDVGPSMADHSPSVKSVGIFGQLTGGRANVIIPDDVEVPNNSETQTMRDKLSERVKEFDAVLKPGGRVIYLGTPQTEASLYNQLPSRGYECRVWPARYPLKDQMKNYGERLAPVLLTQLEKDANLSGKPTDPNRFDEFDLQEREMSYGRSGFALQFMLDTRLSDQDRYPLKLTDLVVMGLNPQMAPQKTIWGGDPSLVLSDLTCVGLSGDRYYRPAYIDRNDWIPYTGAVMFIDPSGRGKDETSYSVVKMLNGFLYNTAGGGIQGGYDDDTMEKICKTAKQQEVSLILIESNFGDGMFTALLKPHLRKIYPCTVEEVRHSKQKEMRIIDTLEPVMNQHRLIVDRTLVEEDYTSTKHLPPEKQLQYQLFYQMSRITKDKGALAHDDRLDALAGAVAYWVEVMAQDADGNIEDRAEELLRAELEIFHGISGISIDMLAMGADPDLAIAHAKGGGRGYTWQ